MNMRIPEGSREHRENSKDYELYISVTRHGPKAGQHSEELSESGKQDVADYFYEAYEGVPIDSRNRKVVSSKVKRVLQTTRIAENSLEQYNEAEPVAVEIAEGISELGVDDYVRSLPEEQRENWFQDWYKSEEGHKATANFIGWLLEQISNARQAGGKLEIDTYSHGPVMAAFLVRLEDQLGLQFIARGKDDPLRLNRNKLLGEGGDFSVLSNFNIQVSSKNPELIRIIFHGKTTEVPLDELEKIR